MVWIRHSSLNLPWVHGIGSCYLLFGLEIISSDQGYSTEYCLVGDYALALAFLEMFGAIIL